MSTKSSNNTPESSKAPCAKKILRGIRSAAAYIWAFICIIIVFAIFLSSDSLSKGLIKLTSMKLDPEYSGGAIINEIQTDTLEIKLHEPVFPALIGESRYGFIQVEFHPVAHPAASAANQLAAFDQPAAVASALPAQITAPLDYTGDGTPDFILEVNTLTGDTSLKVCPSKNMSIGVSTKVKDWWMVRVSLPNPRKSPQCAPTTCAACPASVPR